MHNDAYPQITVCVEQEIKNSMLNGLIMKNNKKVKLTLALFFALSLLIETTHRYYYRAEWNFRFSWTEIELLILIILILINPKGIKILVSSVLLFLIFFASKSVFIDHMSNTSRALLLRDVFKRTDIDKSFIYIFHMIIYFALLISMFKTKSKTNLEAELLDQKIE